ncbi:restriction endonuclease [Leuconostoc mesenteroides]|uniref:restriction endonuclease n=1 Tax=Leuconostoc mesenteroides TaxID=1245 RepID=UPI001CBD7F04|nr:restriction endonuclease [Leuconostoc mesenteroides]MBZ1540495.1 restriction endonuclease [Leuconostoc mesenteroides]
MKKKIDTSKFLNTEKIDTVLEDTKNRTPRLLQRTFNFKGRKSPEIVKKLIVEVSKESENIVDPFLGSGSTMFATLAENRFFYGAELDNYTYNFLAVLCTEVDYSKLDMYFENIKSAIYDEVQSLYSTLIDGHEVFVKKVLFDPSRGKDGYYNPVTNRDIVNGCNIILTRKTKEGIKSKKFDDSDWQKIQNIDSMDVSNFPTDRYIANSRINITSSTGADEYGRNFTHRAKVALLKIQEQISKLPKSNERRFLQYALVSALTLTRVAQYGSSSDILYQVMREKAQEKNAWEEFTEKIKIFKKFQKEYDYVLVKDFQKNSKFKIINGSYWQLLSGLEHKIDAIVTDFPYTDQVPYLERHQMYRIWLEHFADDGVDYRLSDKMLNEELVVSNAPTRAGKNIDQYYEDIDKMMMSFSQTIKDYGQLVFILNLGRNKYFTVFAKIINYARKHGFEYIARADINHSDPSMRKQSAHVNTLMKDAVATFIKLPSDKQYFYIEDLNFEKVIINTTYQKITKSVTKSVPLNSLIIDFLTEIERNGVNSSDKSQIVERVIKDNFHFEYNSHLVELDQNELYLEQAAGKPNELFNRLIDLVPRYVNMLLLKFGKFTLEDLYLELIDNLIDGVGKAFDELLEDSKSLATIKSVLDDYTDQVDGFYVKKTIPEGYATAVKDLNMMNPYDFEKLIKKLFVEKGYLNVVRKGGAGDLGVDITGYYPNADGEKELWLIQVKRWVHNVGSEPLQRLVSERQRLEAQKAIVITTADFTNDAKLISEQQDVYTMNGNQLISELNKIWPGDYIKLLDSK